MAAEDTLEIVAGDRGSGALLWGGRYVIGYGTRMGTTARTADPPVEPDE